MNNNDERDYAEEAANRAELEASDDSYLGSLNRAHAEHEHKGRVLVERLAERMAEADPDGEAEWKRQRDDLIERIEGWQAAGHEGVPGQPLPRLATESTAGAFNPAPAELLLISSAHLCPQMPPPSSRNPLVQVAEVVQWLKMLWETNPDFDRQYVLEQVQARLEALVCGEL